MSSGGSLGAGLDSRFALGNGEVQGVVVIQCTCTDCKQINNNNSDGDVSIYDCGRVAFATFS